MGRDKQKTGKKVVGSKGKSGEKFKRRNSLTDDSLVSSSSCSSGSSNSSTFSNEDPSPFQTKCAMTQNDESVSNSSHNSSNDEQTSNKSDIASDSSNKGNNKEPSSSSSLSRKKKNQKERKLTKKERREQLESEGSSKMGANELQNISRMQVENAIRNDENVYTFQRFDDWPNEPTGKMQVRGMNNAARELIGGETTDIPFYGKAQNAGIETSKDVSESFISARRNGHMRYFQHVGYTEYNNFSNDQKMLQRMGFGVAGTGLHDDMPKLSFENVEDLNNRRFSDCLEKSFHIINWRSNFAANLIDDDFRRGPRSAEVEDHMRKHVEEMVDNETDPWKKATMKLVLDGEVIKLIERVKEIDRVFIKKDIERRKKQRHCEMPKYSETPPKERFDSIVKLILSWLTSEYLENAPEYVPPMDGRLIQVKRGVSVIMYLSASQPNEAPCFKNDHRKCSMLSFLLGSLDRDTKRNILHHSFTCSLTPLHFSAMTGWPCQIDVLLKHGSGTEVTSDYAMTPLYFAARRNCTLMARQLMWHGADLGAMDRKKKFDLSTLELEYLVPNYNDERYLSHKFILTRQNILQSVFTSWLSNYLSECDDNIYMEVRKNRSVLHMCRIGPTLADKCVYYGFDVFLKTVPMHFYRGDRRGPLALFLIPAMYTKKDTTMRAEYPHIVRVPLIHNSEKLAAEMSDVAKNPLLAGNTKKREEESRKLLKNSKIAKLLLTPPIIVFEDSDRGREMTLSPLFDIEHNGCLYAYMLPSIVDNAMSHVDLKIKLSFNGEEIEGFENAFFMIQIVELMGIQKKKEKVDVIITEEKVNTPTVKSKRD